MDLRDQIRGAIPPRQIAEISRRSGVPRPNISRFLNGHQSMMLDGVEKIAAALGMQLVLMSTDPIDLTP